MSRSKRILGGVGFGYANQLLTMVAGLWLTPFLLGRVGQAEYGLWLVGTQVLTYLTLMDFGVVALLPRAAAYATGRAGGVGHATELPEVIGQTIRLTLWQMPLVAAAAAVLWLGMPQAWEPLRLPLGLVMLSFVITFPLRVFQAALLGLQDLAFIGKATLVSWAAGFALTVLMVYARCGLYSLAAAWVMTQVMSVSIFGFRLVQRFPEALPRRLPKLPRSAARAQLGNAFWVSVAQVAQVLLNGTDILILGKVLGPLAVVPYACTGKLIGVLSNQPQMLMQSAGPALSELKVSESRQRLFQVCTALSQAVLIASGAVACVVLSVNNAFVNWWVGGGQYGGAALSVLLLVAMMLRHWNTTAVYSIFCFGYERHISVTTLLDGAVTVGGMLILVPLCGPAGAPLGTIIGVTFVSLPRNLSALARESGVSFAVLLSPLWPWLWRFCVVASGAWLSAWLVPPRGVLAIAAAASLTGLAYLLIMWPLALRGQLGLYVRPRLAALRAKFFPALPVRDAGI
jgi:O-antigen/teichoic acid export membrane protein